MTGSSLDAHDDPPRSCGVRYQRDCIPKEGCVVSAITNMVHPSLTPYPIKTTDTCLTDIPHNRPGPVAPIALRSPEISAAFSRGHSPTAAHRSRRSRWERDPRPLQQKTYQSALYLGQRDPRSSRRFRAQRRGEGRRRLVGRRPFLYHRGRGNRMR